MAICSLPISAIAKLVMFWNVCITVYHDVESTTPRTGLIYYWMIQLGTSNMEQKISLCAGLYAIKAGSKS